jgi:hypothetical protein
MSALLARVRLLAGDTVPGTAGQLTPPLPPVPTTAASGGTVLAGTYQVLVTYVNVTGETLGSAAGTVTTTGSTSTITIPSPAPSGAATGYYAYVSQANGSVLTRQEAPGSPTTIGVSLVLTAPPTNTGANPPTSNTSGATVFSDQQVQDWLDRSRQLVRYELLTPAPDIVPPASGPAPAQFNWATYVSRYGDWESNEFLQGNLPGGISWQLLTPLTSDELTGRWTFDVTLPTISTSIPAQLPPVFISGFVYDPYLAAAELLEMWAAQLTDAFDFESDGQRFHRSQRLRGKLELARAYRMQAKPVTVSLVRGDMQASTAIQPVHLIGESNDFGR